MPTAVKEHTTQKHTGFGKVILFGEHFVVYGAEALVAGISEYTSCELALTRGVPGVQVDDRRPAVPGYIKEKRTEQQKAHTLVLNHLNIDTSVDGLKISLGGPLVPSSGIGASASDVVALSRALGELYGIDLTDDAVNQSAFVGEGGYHGTPSGVDNTAATFGGLISYCRRNGKSQFQQLHLDRPLYLVVVGTGITASTTKVVGDVRKQKAEHPEFFKELFDEYSVIAEKAKAALQQGDLVSVGKLMSKTHGVCRRLGVSCPELESIVECCAKNHALGAKLSGTGRGGIAVALVGGVKEQEELMNALHAGCPAAKFVWQYTVNPKRDSSL